MPLHLRTKSVYSPIRAKQDGLRVLATRFRGRGLLSSRYDVWMPNLAPSEKLLRAAQQGKTTWAAFVKAYRAEILEGGPVDKRCATIKNHGQKFTLRLLRELASRGPVTLLCHCDDDQLQCHRHTLARLIEKA